jgi:S1-C subfamily serine protease
MTKMGIKAETVTPALAAKYKLATRQGIYISVVQTDSPAGKAGIGPGMQILAVNGLRYSADGLRYAIKESKTATTPMTIEFQNDDVVKTVSVDYRGGTREPHLERDTAKSDMLAQVLAPRAK